MCPRLTCLVDAACVSPVNGGYSCVSPVDAGFVYCVARAVCSCGCRSIDISAGPCLAQIDRNCRPVFRGRHVVGQGDPDMPYGGSPLSHFLTHASRLQDKEL